MEKVGGMRSGSEVIRRTAPLKVIIGLLYREFDAAKGGDSVTVNRELLESVITTLECVVEDVEARSAAKADARPGVSDGAARTVVAGVPR